MEKQGLRGFSETLRSFRFLAPEILTRGEEITIFKLLEGKSCNNSPKKFNTNVAAY
jgi:hypothetical protein